MSCVVYYVALLIPSDCDKEYTHLCRHSTLHYVFNDTFGLAQPIDARVRIQTLSDEKSYPRLYPLNRRVVENRKRRVGIRTGFPQSGRSTHWYLQRAAEGQSFCNPRSQPSAISILCLLKADCL